MQKASRYLPAVRTGGSYERQARLWPVNSVGWRRAHQQAFVQYNFAVVNLEPWQRIYTAQARPDVYIGLAKAHLDAARELVFLGNPVDARFHIREARFLLNSVIYFYPQNPYWSWETYYLLGDVNLYDDDAPDALADYQASANMNQDFAPAAAMVQYLDQGGAAADGPLPAPGPAPVTPQQVTLDAATPLAPSTAPDQLLPPVSPPPANPPVQDATNTNGLVKNMNQVQPAPNLVSNMSGISAGRALEYVGATLTVVAAILGATEVGAVMTAFVGALGSLATLGGMAAEDSTKP